MLNDEFFVLPVSFFVFDTLYMQHNIYNTMNNNE
jgi:hypothetical protein